MAGSIQSKGDGEYPYSAPFSGLNASAPSILLPASAQDIQTSPSFTIERGSLAAPWPYGNSLFGFNLAAGEYLLFVTPDGYLFTNAGIYQFQAGGANEWSLVLLAAMPAGDFPVYPSGPNTQPVPFVEANGCIFFSCLLGIYRFDTVGMTIAQWAQVSESDTASPFYAQYITIFEQRMVVVGTTATPTTPSPAPIPISPLTIAWSVVSDFSATSVGSFNVNPDVDSGVVGGYDVLTNYSQGLPSGLILIGHSLYIIMTQGIVEMDPLSSGTSAFTFYNWWQQNAPVGGMMGSVAQWGEMGAFITPDNVVIFSPGGIAQIGNPITQYIRSILKRIAIGSNLTHALFGSFGPPMNSSFFTMFGELHYGVVFSCYGFPPLLAAYPYPAMESVQTYFTLLLDYNFASESWSQQLFPYLHSQFYQLVGPSSLGAATGVPSQNLLIAGQQTLPSSEPEICCVAADEFFNYPSQAESSAPQKCLVGFPQTPVSSGHRPAVRRVRIEYGWDELSLVGASEPVQLTVSMQGTITRNTGATGGNGNATTEIVHQAVTIQVEPPGNYKVNQVVTPALIATAYADFVLSLENPQVSLSWTDPSPSTRLLIHRVTLLVNDTQGVLQ